MEEIKIMEKPDWVSWKQVQECQRLSHSVNQARGIDMLCSHLSPEELEKEVGDGKCFVALDGNRVVGTVSYNYDKIQQNWCRGNAAYLCMGGVLPDYSGRGLYSKLSQIRMDYIKKDSRKIDCVWMTTAEKNKKIQKIYQRNGFYYVQLKASPLTDYYSVVMAKRITGTNPNHFLQRLKFFSILFLFKLRYKPGHIKRFV